MTRERQSQCSGKLNTDSFFFFFNSLRWGGLHQISVPTDFCCMHVLLIVGPVLYNVRLQTTIFYFLIKLLKYGSGEIQL